MAEDLTACPFCGSDEFLILSNSLLGSHSFWQVECGCHASGAPEFLREDAIRIWNTRIVPDAPDETARLRAALEFYADPDGDGYDVQVFDYGLSTRSGEIIQDGGDRARAALESK